MDRNGHIPFRKATEVTEWGRGRRIVDDHLPIRENYAHHVDDPAAFHGRPHGHGTGGNSYPPDGHRMPALSDMQHVAHSEHFHADHHTAQRSHDAHLDPGHFFGRDAPPHQRMHACPSMQRAHELRFGAPPEPHTRRNEFGSHSHARSDLPPYMAPHHYPGHSMVPRFGANANTHPVPGASLLGPPPLLPHKRAPSPVNCHVAQPQFGSGSIGAEGRRTAPGSSAGSGTSRPRNKSLANGIAGSQEVRYTLSSLRAGGARSRAGPVHRDLDNPDLAMSGAEAGDDGEEEDFTTLVSRYTMLKKENEIAADVTSGDPNSLTAAALSASNRLLSEDIPIPGPPPVMTSQLDSKQMVHSGRHGAKETRREAPASFSSDKLTSHTEGPGNIYSPIGLSDLTGSGAKSSSCDVPSEIACQLQIDECVTECVDECVATAKPVLSSSDVQVHSEVPTDPKFRPFKIVSGRKQNPIVIDDVDDSSLGAKNTAAGQANVSFGSFQSSSTDAGVADSAIATAGTCVPGSAGHTAVTVGTAEQTGAGAPTHHRPSSSSVKTVAHERPGVDPSCSGELQHMDIRQKLLAVAMPSVTTDLSLEANLHALSDAGRKNAVPTGDASQNLSEESKQLSGKRGRRRRARTRKRERKLSAGVAISLSGPSEGEEPYGAVVESDLDQFSPTKTPVAPGSSVSRHVSMVRDRSPLSRTSIESLHDEMPSNDGEQHASCSAGGVASFVEKDIGSAVEDDEEDKKLSAMRERLLNSMAKKSVGLQSANDSQLAAEKKPSDEIAGKGVNPPMDLKWLHPDPVIIHLGRDSSDSSDEEEVTGHVQRVPIQARPLVVQPSRSSTPPQMATSSRGSTTAGLGGLSVDALLKSVRSGVEDREKKAKEKVRSASGKEVNPSEIDDLRARLARLTKENDEKVASLKKKKGSRAGKLKQGYGADQSSPGVNSMCSSPNPGSAEASPPPPPLPTISGLVVSRDAGAEDVDGGTQTTPAGHSRQPPESSMLVCGTVAEKASTHVATVLSVSGRSTLDHVGSSRSTPTVTNAVTALVTPASHSASAEHVRSSVRDEKTKLSRLMIDLLCKEQEQIDQCKKVEELEMALKAARMAYSDCQLAVRKLQKEVDDARLSIAQQEARLSRLTGDSSFDRVHGALRPSGTSERLGARATASIPVPAAGPGIFASASLTASGASGSSRPKSISSKGTPTSGLTTKNITVCLSNSQRSSVKMSSVTTMASSGKKSLSTGSKGSRRLVPTGPAGSRSLATRSGPSLVSESPTTSSQAVSDVSNARGQYVSSQLQSQGTPFPASSNTSSCPSSLSGRASTTTAAVTASLSTEHCAPSQSLRSRTLDPVQDGAAVPIAADLAKSNEAMDVEFDSTCNAGSREFRPDVFLSMRVSSEGNSPRSVCSGKDAHTPDRDSECNGSSPSGEPPSLRKRRHGETSRSADHAAKRTREGRGALGDAWPEEHTGSSSLSADTSPLRSAKRSGSSENTHFSNNSKAGAGTDDVAPQPRPVRTSCRGVSYNDATARSAASKSTEEKDEKSTTATTPEASQIAVSAEQSSGHAPGEVTRPRDAKHSSSSCSQEHPKKSRDVKGKSARVPKQSGTEQLSPDSTSRQHQLLSTPKCPPEQGKASKASKQAATSLRGKEKPGQQGNQSSQLIDSLREEHLAKEKSLSDLCSACRHIPAWSNRLLPYHAPPPQPLAGVVPGPSDGGRDANKNDEDDLSMDMDISVANTPSRFKSYRTPLSAFQSYRWTPDFKREFPASTATFKSSVEPERQLCRYDLHGTCNDADCPWQHLSAAISSTEEQPSLPSTTDTVTLLFEHSVERPKPATPCSTRGKQTEDMSGIGGGGGGRRRDTRAADASAGTGSEKSELQVAMMSVRETVSSSPALSNRYFSVERNVDAEVQRLQTHLESSPTDVTTWLKLRELKRDLAGSKSLSDALSVSLHVLAKALEHNRQSEELWVPYLQCYAEHCKNVKELHAVLEKAIAFCPKYSVLQQNMLLSQTYPQKVKACETATEFLLAECEKHDTVNDVLSHQLLETCLYRVHVDVIASSNNKQLVDACSRLEQFVLPEEDGGSVSLKAGGRFLTIPDLCILLLSLLHILGVKTMPADLYSPTALQPSMIVCKDMFVVPWHLASISKETSKHILKLFEVFLKLFDKITDMQAVDCRAVFHVYRNATAFLVSEREWVLAGHMVNSSHVFMKSRSTSDLVLTCIMGAEVFQIRDKPVSKIQQMFASVLKTNSSIALSYHHALLFPTPGLMFSTLETGFRSCCYKKEYHSAISSISKRLYLLHFALGLWTPHDLDINPDWLQPLSNHDRTYLWLMACLWHDKISECQKYDHYLQEFQGHYVFNIESTFQSALSDLHGTDGEKIIWEELLLYHHRKLTASSTSSSDLERFDDLCFRAMAAVSPVRRSLCPGQQLEWRDYRFHNMVISLLLSTKSHGKQMATLDELIATFPNNVGLAMRAVDHALQQEPLCIDQARHYLATVLASHPSCVDLWKMAIKLECFTGQIKQARWMYQQATQAIPLSASLWTEYLLFELAHNCLNKPWLSVLTEASKYGIKVKTAVSRG